MTFSEVSDGIPEFAKPGKAEWFIFIKRKAELHDSLLKNKHLLWYRYYQNKYTNTARTELILPISEMYKNYWHTLE